jgi:hypothetical protein
MRLRVRIVTTAIDIICKKISEKNFENFSEKKKKVGQPRHHGTLKTPTKQGHHI